MLMTKRLKVVDPSYGRSACKSIEKECRANMLCVLETKNMLVIKAEHDIDKHEIPALADTAKWDQILQVFSNTKVCFKCKAFQDVCKEPGIATRCCFV